jgi:hypothetical protein
MLSRNRNLSGLARPIVHNAGFAYFQFGPYSVHARIQPVRRMDRDAPRKVVADLQEERPVFMENALFPTGLQTRMSVAFYRR